MIKVLKNRVKSLIERKQWLRVVYVACKRFYDNSLFSKDVGALTFSTFTSLVPLLAVLFALARMCGLDDVFINWLVTILKGQPAIADRVVGIVHNYLMNTSNQAIIYVGIAFMLYPLYSLMNKIDISFSNIWGVRERPLGLRLFGVYILLYVVFFILLFLTLFFNLQIYAFIYVMDEYDLISDFMTYLLPCLSVIPLTIFFLVMYCYIPNTYVKLSHALVPSVVTSVVIEVIKYLYIYLQVFLTSYNVIYGSLAVIPLFLMWLQVVWSVIEIGVSWTFALHETDKNVSEQLLIK